MSGAGVGAPLHVVQVVRTEGFGGIERYITTLANGLADRGCRVAVLGGEQRRMTGALSSGVESWHPARGVLEIVARLAAIGPVDIVHAHMTHAELGAVLASPRTRARLVVSRHFPGPRGATRSGALAAVAIRRAVALQLASSADVAARVDGPSRVVLPGVAPVADPPGVVPVADPPPSEGEPGRERVVLVLQRLEPEKDTATALRAWASSGLADQGWELHLAGDGRERARLEELAAALDLTASSRFRGAVDDVGPLLARASILLATGPDEAFGLSVLEAMAWGVPVVATRAAGHLENVGICSEAALFAPGDAGEAGRLLRELAADARRRAAYGDALRALQRERFTADRQVQETLALYRSLPRRV